MGNSTSTQRDPQLSFDVNPNQKEKRTKKWQAEDGQQRYSTEVHVNEFNFLNNRSDSQPENTDNTVAQTPNPPQQENQADDLPF